MQVHSQTVSIHHNPELQKKLFERLDTKKNLKKSDFLSILYSEPLQDYTKPKFNFDDRVRIST